MKFQRIPFTPSLSKILGRHEREQKVSEYCMTNEGERKGNRGLCV